MKKILPWKVHPILFSSRGPLVVLRFILLLITVVSVLALLISTLWAGLVFVHPRFELSISNPLRPAFLALLFALFYELINKHIKVSSTGEAQDTCGNGDDGVSNGTLYAWSGFILFSVILARVIFHLNGETLFPAILLYASVGAGMYIAIRVLRYFGAATRDVIPCIFFLGLVPPVFGLNWGVAIAFFVITFTMIFFLPRVLPVLPESKHIFLASVGVSVVVLLCLLFFVGDAWSLQRCLSRIKILTYSYFWLWFVIPGAVFAIVDRERGGSHQFFVSCCVALPAFALVGAEHKMGSIGMVLALPFFLFAICQCFMMINKLLQKWQWTLFSNVLYLCIYAFMIAWLRQNPFWQLHG